MHRLAHYVRLANSVMSFGKLADQTRFSSRQLWTMANGGPAPARDSDDGPIEPARDERFLLLASLIPPEHSVDPEDVRRAAQETWEARNAARAARRVSSRVPASSASLAEAYRRACDVGLDEVFIDTEQVIRLAAERRAVAFEREWQSRAVERAAPVGHFLPQQRDQLESIKKLARFVAGEPSLDEKERMAVARLLRVASSEGAERLAELIRLAKGHEER
jgi:hypothetical protein